MSTKYLLVFLLGLVVIAAAATTEHGGNTAINERRQMPFVKRFYSRGWATIKGQPSKPIEKSHEQPKLLSGARKTMQKVEEKPRNDHDEDCSRGTEQAMQNMEGMDRDKAAGCLRGTENRNIAGISGHGMPENRSTSFVRGVQKTTMEKPEGYGAKRSIHKVEDIYQ